MWYSQNTKDNILYGPSAINHINSRSLVSYNEDFKDRNNSPISSNSYAVQLVNNDGINWNSILINSSLIIFGLSYNYWTKYTILAWSHLLQSYDYYQSKFIFVLIQKKKKKQEFAGN